MTVELWDGTVERSADGVTFTAVAKVLGVKVPQVSFEKKRTTTLDNNVKVHTYKKGFGEPGDFSVTCQYDIAGYTAALADHGRASTFYRVTMSDGSQFECEVLAQVTPPEPTELDGVLEFAIGGPVSGSVDWVAA